MLCQRRKLFDSFDDEKKTRFFHSILHQWTSWMMNGRSSPEGILRWIRKAHAACVSGSVPAFASSRFSQWRRGTCAMRCQREVNCTPDFTMKRISKNLKMKWIDPWDWKNICCYCLPSKRKRMELATFYRYEMCEWSIWKVTNSMHFVTFATIVTLWVSICDRFWASIKEHP